MPTAALNLGIQTLGEIIQLTPVSPALAILSTSRNILLMVNADKSRNKDEQHLARMVLDIATAYSDGLKKLDEGGLKDVEIERISDNLHRCLQSISKGLLEKPTPGLFSRILSQSATKKRLRGWGADLEHISLLLETQIRLRSTHMSHQISLESSKALAEGAVAERMQQANEEALNLIKSHVSKQVRKKMHKSSFGHFPPTPSAIFFGRSVQVEHLVASLVQVPAYHAVLGPGGMGKTSLGLNVLHDPRIVEVYGKNRYFLACETRIDADGIIAGLADIFDLSEAAFVKLFKGLCEVIGSDVLFLLDNFETPWERKEARQKVEDLLMELSSIPNLSIVITLRGAERPGGIRWSRPFLPALGPLEPSAARQAFMAIADVSDDDADMTTLLAEVEFIPLAITLLAAQVPYTNCAFLLEQWQSCKTSMVTRGWDNRLSSLDVSISLSLASSRFLSNPHALYLLQILSLLPDGATLGELRQMTTGDIELHHCLSTLLQVALATIDLHDRARVLAPVREHVRLKHPVPHDVLQRVFSYHADLARYARTSLYTAEVVNMDDKLKSSVGNIYYVIRVSLDAEPLTTEAINSAIDVASFRRTSRSGSISHLLEKSIKIARGSENPVLLAACMQEIAIRMCYNTRGRRLLALECLQDAASILRPLSNPESCDLLIAVLGNLSWTLAGLECWQEALLIAEEAVALLGVVEYAQGDSSFAVRHLNQAAIFYGETEGKAWVEFCKGVLRLISEGVHLENIPVFPPVHLDGF